MKLLQGICYKFSDRQTQIVEQEVREFGDRDRPVNGKVGKNNLIILELEKNILCFPSHGKNPRYAGSWPQASPGSSAGLMMCNKATLSKAFASLGCFDA